MIGEALAKETLADKDATACFVPRSKRKSGMIGSLIVPLAVEDSVITAILTSDRMKIVVNVASSPSLSQNNNGPNAPS